MNFKKFQVIKGDHKSDKTHLVKYFFRNYVISETISTLNSKKLKYYIKINVNNVVPIS